MSEAITDETVITTVTQAASRKNWSWTSSV